MSDLEKTRIVQEGQILNESRAVQEGTGEVTDWAPQIMSLDVTAVPGLTSAQIMVIPHQIFQATSFLVSGADAEHFMIEEIRIGNLLQLISRHPIHAVMFTANPENPFGYHMNFDLCQVSMQMRVSLRNIDRQTRRFISAFYGKTPNFR